jgi:predicted nucleotidyltransferase
MIKIKEKVNINEIIDLILKDYGPVEKILLFGSQVSGQADAYSDLDLIIIKKTKRPFIERLAEVPLLPVHTDIFVYTPEEFEEMIKDENPFIVSALEYAKVIYEKS